MSPLILQDGPNDGAPINGNGILDDNRITNSNHVINGNGIIDSHDTIESNHLTNGNGAINGNGINGTNQPAVQANGASNGEPTFTALPSKSPNPSPTPIQTPIAVIGMACRLPGKSNSPEELWKFLMKGGIADPTPPSHRYDITTHYDGSARPGTMTSPGGTLLKDVDITAFDAPFFKLGHHEAAVMDPQQRQLLEVTYECLENSGVSLEKIRGTRLGCVVANNAVEYEGFAVYDREDHVSGGSTGFSRSILSNRISHFLDIHGPSISIDTACSGTLVGVDLACRYLQCNSADGVLVGGALLYLDPSSLQDTGPMKGAFSPTGYCRTFDASADGYIRGEAISCVYLKRLDDAIRDGDPIRAVIRGSATNSDGNTASLTQPSSEAQEVAIRTAYRNAGITNFNETGYLECHGTGTPTGDPIEVAGLAAVFAPTRPAEKPLIIGSIKSNVGHSESAAGLSGLIKAVLTVESGVIPGTPSFIKPTPRIDFEKSRVRPTRESIRFPKMPSGLRRASVNSFGFGGSNAHVVIESRDSMVKLRKEFVFSSHGSHIFGGLDRLPETTETGSKLPQVLVFSANDKEGLDKAVQTLADHLIDPAVNARLSDVAYTLSERRSHHFYRGFIVSKSTSIAPESMIAGKKKAQPPRVAFIFTGQGAQWSQMGKDLIDAFPMAKSVVESLDVALQTLADPPQWSLLQELTEERDGEVLRLPEFSQPLVTALQIALLTVLSHWGISASRVLGHSSGEIAAAVAAKLITPEEAIKIAYLRGLAAKSHHPEQPLGMLAVGAGVEIVAPYLESEPTVQIACYNSPVSLTLSGPQSCLQHICDHLQKDGLFARMLQVNLAYHSSHIGCIAKEYHRLLQEENLLPTGTRGSEEVTMFSSVTAGPVSLDDELYKNGLSPEYWRLNMISPVKFAQTAANILSGKEGSEFIIEIGPTGALAGPVAQVIKASPVGSTQSVVYTSASKRGADTLQALYEVAGKLWTNSGAVDMRNVNGYDNQPSDSGVNGSPKLIVDLPNYQWTHKRRYWRESLSATEFLHRPFISHDLLGSKILSVPWHNPTFYRVLELSEVPWLRDHMIGDQVIFPAAGYLAMAIEAIHQTAHMNQWKDQKPPAAFTYCLKDILFFRTIVLEEKARTKISLAMSPVHGSPRKWYNFRIRSMVDGVWVDHCSGLARIDEEEFDITAPPGTTEPLQHPEPGDVGYSNANAGEFYFGPSFRVIEAFEWHWGKPGARGQVNMEYPTGAYLKQSYYPVHPVPLDGVLQLAGYAIAQMQMNALNDIVCVPSAIEAINIPFRTAPTSKSGLVHSVASMMDSSASQSYGSRYASSSLYDPADKTLIMEVKRIRFDPISARGDQSEHVYMHFGWIADTSLTDANGLNAFLVTHNHTLSSTEPVNAALERGGTENSHRVQSLLTTFSQNKPDLAVLEINLEEGDDTCLWLDEPARKLAGGETRRGFIRYHFISPDAKSVSHLQEAHKDSAARATWELLDVTHLSGTITSAEKFDLVILKARSWTPTGRESKSILHVALSNILPVMSEEGSLFFLGSQNAEETSMSMKTAENDEMEKLLKELSFADIKDLSPSLGDVSLLAKFSEAGSTANVKRITCFRFFEDGEETGSKAAANPVLDALKEKGWTIELCSMSRADDLPPNSNLLILDELFGTIASQITPTQFQTLQKLIKRECNILWVTKGGLMIVTDPDRAAAPGLLRTIRSEELGLRLISLDVEHPTGPNTVHAIDKCLARLLSPAPASVRKDSEYVERRGVIHTPRLMADPALNEAKHENTNGRKALLEDLHEKNTPVSLGVERVGSIDSLHYCERASFPLSVRDDCIEIEIQAAGINFKDLAIALGIVSSTDPFVLGGEAAGIITRVGAGVGAATEGSKKFVPGQRVVAMFPGSFGNRIQVPWQVAHVIPDTLSFEEAATLPVAFVTAMHGLFDLANLQKGHRVLIHSATGGTGSAAVQLCQYIGAEIFATAGSEEKRQFLQSAYNIPADHIFSSRTTAFEHGVMQLTNGLGVDVILNSLTGDLLEASWNIIAHGGTMVEIGKKDIMEHSRLSMEPFSRGASFRALDVSLDTANMHQKGPELGRTLSRLFDQLFSLLEAGHILPIFPIQTFAFDKVVDAFFLMRSTKHMGKLVLSRNSNGPDKVQIRPYPRLSRFRPDVTYMLVGSLKGICGSLAIDFAKKGAKHLAVVGRSGYEDAQSQSVLRQLRHLNCQMDLLRGDITKLEDVRRIFNETSVPVGGIVQGAMVLRDRPFAIMTVQEYHEAIACKIQGTWNLHNVALERGSDLDFFTLLSSISSVLGNPAQGNYAAGCSFQDSFSSYRHGLGLPCSSVNLGIIEKVGYMARNEELLEKNLSTRVAHGIDEKLLVKIVAYANIQQSRDPVSLDPFSQTRMVTGLTMPQPEDSLLRIDARFSPLFIQQDADARKAGGRDGGAGSARDEGQQEIKELNLMLRSKNVRSVNMSELVDATISVVSNYLTRSMRLSEPIEPERSLSAYGIDSLAAVEFRNWLRLELGAPMSVIDITTAASLIILSEKIIAKLEVQESK